MISDCQKRALDFVRSQSKPSAPIDPTIDVTLNFHPDRVTVDKKPILNSLLEQGCYLSQFMTKQSNGGMSAFPGGSRWDWESRIFGQAYDEAHDRDRPVYGALNFRRKQLGGAPRFGSAYFVLHPSVLERCTFCYPDSFFNPEDFGTIDSGGYLLDLAMKDDKDALDDYIEAQVHGPVHLDRDVVCLVLDPSFRGTAVEEDAQKLPCTIRWHCGARLSFPDLESLYSEYRGEEVVDVARQIAVDGYLNAKIIGDAVATNQWDAQLLKKVWHCVARYGDPVE